MPFTPPAGSTGAFAFMNGDIWGCGVPGDARLIRCVGHQEEMHALASGYLSMRQAALLSDPLEGRETDADRAWLDTWYGRQNTTGHARFNERIAALKHTTFISCWHQTSYESDIPRLLSEYVPGEFKCVLQGGLSNLHAAFPSGEGALQLIDLVAARYLPDETRRRNDILEEGGCTSLAPAEFIFKRAARYSWEKEARFILFDQMVGSVYPGPRSLLARSYPERFYAPIVPSELVIAIYALNEHTHDLVQTMNLGIPISLIRQEELLQRVHGDS